MIDIQKEDEKLLRLLEGVSSKTVFTRSGSVYVTSGSFSLDPGIWSVFTWEDSDGIHLCGSEGWSYDAVNKRLTPPGWHIMHGSITAWSCPVERWQSGSVKGSFIISKDVFREQTEERLEREEISVWSLTGERMSAQDGLETLVDPDILGSVAWRLEIFKETEDLSSAHEDAVETDAELSPGLYWSWHVDPSDILDGPDRCLLVKDGSYWRMTTSSPSDLYAHPFDSQTLCFISTGRVILGDEAETDLQAKTLRILRYPWETGDEAEITIWKFRPGTIRMDVVRRNVVETPLTSVEYRSAVMRFLIDSGVNVGKATFLAPLKQTGEVARETVVRETRRSDGTCWLHIDPSLINREIMEITFSRQGKARFWSLEARESPKPGSNMTHAGPWDQLEISTKSGFTEHAFIAGEQFNIQLVVTGGSWNPIIRVINQPSWVSTVTSSHVIKGAWPALPLPPAGGVWNQITARAEDEVWRLDDAGQWTYNPEDDVTRHEDELDLSVGFYRPFRILSDEAYLVEGIQNNYTPDVEGGIWDEKLPEYGIDLSIVSGSIQGMSLSQKDFSLTGQSWKGFPLWEDGQRKFLSGIPVGLGDFMMRIGARNAFWNSDETNIMFHVVEPLVIGPVDFSGIEAGEPFETEVPVSGGVPPYVIDAENLPPGLEIEDGVISGTPEQTGTWVVTIIAEDESGQHAEREETVTIVPPGFVWPKLQFIGTDVSIETPIKAYIIEAIVDQEVSLLPTVIGGDEHYTFTVEPDGEEGEGLSWDLSDCRLSGILEKGPEDTPTGYSSDFLLTIITVESGDGQTDTAAVVIYIHEADEITTDSDLKAAYTGVYYENFIETSRPPESIYISEGEAPPGIFLTDCSIKPNDPTGIDERYLDAAGKGLLRGLTRREPDSASEDWIFTVVSARRNLRSGNTYISASKEMTLKLWKEHVDIISDWGWGESGKILDMQFEASGGSTPYSWELLPGSPLPFSVSASGLVHETVSVPPGHSGEDLKDWFTPILKVTDSDGRETIKVFRFQIYSNFSGIDIPLPEFKVGQQLDVQLEAGAGNPPYSWDARIFPGGSVLGDSSGYVSGIPSSPYYEDDGTMVSDSTSAETEAPMRNRFFDTDSGDRIMAGGSGTMISRGSFTRMSTCGSGFQGFKVSRQPGSRLPSGYTDLDVINPILQSWSHISDVPVYESISGSHVVVITDDGVAMTAGSPEFGRLGHDGNPDLAVSSEYSNLKVLPLTGVISAGMTSRATYFVMSDGTVQSCGKYPGRDSIGSSSSPNLSQIPGLTGIKSVSSGGDTHVLFLHESGNVLSSADSPAFWGELGRDLYYQPSNFIQTHVTPQVVSGLPGIEYVSAGCRFSACLDEDGRIWTFGANGRGQLGRSVEDVSDNNSGGFFITNIGKIDLPEKMKAVSCGHAHLLMLGESGRVWSCGWNLFGQLGHTSDGWRPTMISGLTGITAIAAGYAHSVILRDDGRVMSFGLNDRGQLGRDAPSGWLIDA